MTFKKHWLGSFAWRAIVCTTKVRMKHLEVGKDMKIKHNVSSPKSMGRLFLKKALHGGAHSFGQIYGGMFYMETNDQIMQRRRKSFTSAFSSNLNTANLRIFPGHWRKIHLNINTYLSIELWKDLSVKLMVKRFQRSIQDQFPSRWPWTGLFIYYFKS